MAQSADAPAEADKAEKKDVNDKDNKKTFLDKEEELSEEDLKLKESLEALVLRLSDPKSVASAIDSIGKEIRTSTTSMTSVPKPLKFLRPHFEAMKTAFAGAPKDCKATFADVLSVLATVSGKEEDREALHFRLQGTGCDPGDWGHEYMRHMAGELAAEYHQRSVDSQPVDDLMKLVEVIVPHYMKHNSETEAVDLLLEVDIIEQLLEHIDDKNYQRTCLYLTSAAAFLPEPDDSAVLRTAYSAYKKVQKWHDAMRVALRMNEQSYINEVFNECTDPIDKQQLAYLLARHGTMLDCEDGPCAIADDGLREKVVEIMSNSKLSEKFLTLARDLDVMEPKLPEDVYKMHLVDQRPGGLGNMDSAMKNLSATLVNALLNVGFGVDKLVTPAAEAAEKQWIFRNKEQGKLCATASLGAINMWEVDAGMPQLDKYTYSEDPHVVAGACLGFGLCCCCVRSELDPAFALLYEHVNSAQPWVRIGAVMGLGLAYAGTCKADVQNLLLPLITDPDSPMDLVGHACLALGLVFAATCEQESVEAILQALMMLPEAKLADPFLKFVILGLGLLFLGKQETVEPTLEVAKSLHEKISKYAVVVLDTCAYAGSGNVLKVQEMLALCGEHVDEEEEGKEWQTAHLGPATIGIGLIAMGEDLGSSMACRVLEHLLQYGDPKVRQAVPMALALLNVSNPDMYTMDTLSRLSHDQDGAVTKAAIFAFGFLGAGTNNARLAGMLRSLSAYYTKDPQNLHIVRLAQGMLHMGKGLVTITPFHTDRQLLSHVALAGNLAVLYCGLDMGTTLCGKHAFMLYYLAPAMKPRFLLTIDENGENVPVPVRVGQAVDTVAQAGQPKGITGFQTHNTPVLLGVRDRAELATEKYIAVSPLLEGVVIVRPNPDYVEGEP